MTDEPIPSVALRDGLNRTTSVGFSGLFRPDVEEDIVTLQTVVWRGGWFCMPGCRPTLLFNFDLPESYSAATGNRDWTGKTRSVRWNGGGFDLELRTTLPGPLFRMAGSRLGLRFAHPVEPRKAVGLDTDQTVGLRGGACDGRFWLLDSRPQPILLVSSHPMQRIQVVSHRHWHFEFAKSDANVFVIPLLRADDAPRDAERQAVWSRLAERPPLCCQEQFGFADDGEMILRQTYPDSAVAPRSPLLELLLRRTSLASGRPGWELLKSWFGPYAVTEGQTVHTTLQSDWMRYAAVPRRTVKGELSPLPEPLAFPGDGTWDLRCVGDRLMAWRLWAPHVGQLPSDQRRTLLERLSVPTPEQWRRQVRIETDAALPEVRWARHRDLWAPVGDACYDYDWYNGLALSGLAKACECDEPAVADAARVLARECKEVRADLVRYLQVYHDWRFAMAWTDAFGTLLNIDCAQNGLEGLLAEGNMRRWEGDRAGAAWMEYLACKTGAGLLAMLLMPDWLGENELTMGDQPLREGGLGFKGMYPHSHVAFVDPLTRNPYPFPRRFPQYNALLRRYGPVEQIRSFLETWQHVQAFRYEDWRSPYTNPPADFAAANRQRLIETTPEAGAVETGDQAITMHIVQPELGLRLWTLDQDADEIQRLFQIPLMLSEQLLLRADYRLEPLAWTETRMGLLR